MQVWAKIELNGSFKSQKIAVVFISFKSHPIKICLIVRNGYAKRWHLKNLVVDPPQFLELQSR